MRNRVDNVDVVADEIARAVDVAVGRIVVDDADTQLFGLNDAVERASTRGRARGGLPTGRAWHLRNASTNQQQKSKPERHADAARQKPGPSRHVPSPLGS